MPYIPLSEKKGVSTKKYIPLTKQQEVSFPSVPTETLKPISFGQYLREEGLRQAPQEAQFPAAPGYRIEETAPGIFAEVPIATLREPTPEEKVEWGEMKWTPEEISESIEKAYGPEYIAEKYPERIDPIEYFRKGSSFGWAPDVPKPEATTTKQKVMETAGFLLTATLLSHIASPLIGGTLSKIPGLGKIIPKIVQTMAKHPWKAGYPLSILKSAGIGSLFGAITKAENKKEWAGNVARYAGTFAAFQVIAYPIIQFFKPLYYTISTDKRYWTDPNAKKLLSTKETAEIFTPKKTLYFRHPTKKDIILKVTERRIDVLPASDAPAPAKTYPLIREIEIEAFKYQPSLYNKLKDFLIKGKIFSADITGKALMIPPAPTAPVTPPIIPSVVPPIVKPKVPTEIKTFHRTEAVNVEGILKEGLKPSPSGIFGNVGFSATSKELIAEHIETGEYVELTVRFENPLIIEGQPATLLEESGYKTFEEWAKKEGYDGIIIKNADNKGNDVILTLRPESTLAEAKPIPTELESFEIKGFDTTITGMPYYDELLENPALIKKNRGIEGKIETITPDEYLKRSAEAKGISLEEDLRAVDRTTIAKLVKVLEKGGKLPMPVIEAGKKLQEGKHRVIAAKEFGLKEIPVLEVTQAAKPKPEVKPPTKPTAKEEFKVGDVLDPQGKTNMVGNITIREIVGNTLKFTDAEGTDYSGMARSTVRNFIKEGAWKRVEPEIKPEIKLAKPVKKELPEEKVKPLAPKPKLPKIKKPPIEKGKLYGITIMPDPGLDKFLAEEVRPILNKATEAGKYLLKQIRHIPTFIMRLIEPAKLVAGKPYATVIRGIHKPEARLVEFDQKRLETMDINISELEKWFDKFSDKELENLMLTRGKPTSAEALTIQRDAIKEIPKELKVPAIQKAIQEIADFNYKFLQRVAGKDIHKVEDYFYGMYKDFKMVSKFLDYWRSTEKFTKQKIFPTVADAQAYGLELKHKNPVANLRAEFRAIAKLEGMNWMKEELLRTGEGIYIAETAKAPIKWEKINDPVFKGLVVEPNLARLINNLIATNKITRIPVLNTLRKINNFLRTIKFVGSAFHMIVIGKQSIADSGYLGFAYKKTAIRGATFGFRKNDPMFRTREYREYLELGGGHKYSVEFEAKRVLIDFVDKVNRGNFLGAFTKLGILPVKIPAEFVNFMFNNYIPKVKYSKYLDFVAKREKDLGRIITDKEKIEIVKEGQNFYGMMNERLFGRSGTVTTTLRFFFMAPGFAEGNYRTIIKSFSQWGVKGTYGAGRSRFNIVNSLILTGILATVGTLIFTKKWPEKPEKPEDIRDLFKVDTGYVDDKGRKIMIDLMTYDKDYWNIYFNVLKGRPDVAITESIKRLGGMKAPTAEMLLDFASMLMGKSIYDWKGDEVVELTDPFLIKLQKLAIHEIRRLEPISMSVYKQLRNKEIDRILAFVAAAVGVRATKTEEDRRIQEITSRIYSLKGQQEELYQYLGSIDNPKEAIEKYNKMVNDILDSKMVPLEMQKEWKPKLLIDVNRLLSNKIYQLTSPMTTLTDAEKEKEIARIKKYLQNFEVSIEEAEKQLEYYWEKHPVKDRWSNTHRANVRNRKARLRERY